MAQNLVFINAGEFLVLQNTKQLAAPNQSVTKWKNKAEFLVKDYSRVGENDQEHDTTANTKCLTFPGCTENTDQAERLVKDYSKVEGNNQHTNSAPPAYTENLDQVHGQLNCIVTISIKRSRTRFVTNEDGEEYQERVGQETVTVKAPKGLYYEEPL